MSIARKVLGNLPPHGRGVYARGQSVQWLSQFDFVAVNFDRGDARRVAASLHALGKEVWFYAMPSHWEPDSDFRASIAAHEAAIDATGAAGAICDPENGWRSAPQARADALRDALRDSIKRGYRWGVTSFPEFRYRATMAQSGAWGSPQLYRPSDVAWHGTWVGLFGASMIIPSVSLWPTPQEYTFTQANYPPYLRSIPVSVGAIGWTTDEGHGWMIADYKDWQPWHNVGALAVLLTASNATTPAGIAAIVLLAALAIFAAWKWGK